MTRVFRHHNLCLLFWGGLLFLLTGLPFALAVEDQNGSLPEGIAITRAVQESVSRVSLKNSKQRIQRSKPPVNAGKQPRPSCRKSRRSRIQGFSSATSGCR